VAGPYFRPKFNVCHTSHTFIYDLATGHSYVGQHRSCDGRVGQGIAKTPNTMEGTAMRTTLRRTAAAQQR
jgi:hypothetical protein